MARVKERHLEAKYRRFFGRMAGYLPRCAIRRFTTKNPHGKEPDDGPPIDVNAEIAIAR